MVLYVVDRKAHGSWPWGWTCKAVSCTGGGGGDHRQPLPDIEEKVQQNWYSPTTLIYLAGRPRNSQHTSCYVWWFHLHTRLTCCVVTIVLYTTLYNNCCRHLADWPSNTVDNMTHPFPNSRGNSFFLLDQNTCSWLVWNKVFSGA